MSYNASIDSSAYIVSQMHPEIQIVAGANIVCIEVAPAPVCAAVKEEPEPLHSLARRNWQPAVQQQCLKASVSAKAVQGLKAAKGSDQSACSSVCSTCLGNV